MMLSIYKKMAAVIFGLVILMFLPVNAAYSLQTSTGFYLPLNMWQSDSSYIGYGEPNPAYGNKCHLANDYGKTSASVEGKPVYAIADGTVYSASMSVGNYSGDNPARDGGAIIIEHKTTSGQKFYALYGHVKNMQISDKPPNNNVTAGQQIADVGSYHSGSNYLPHLHFGISLNVPRYDGYTPTASCTDYLGFVNPEKFLQDNSPATLFLKTKCQGNICWSPANTNCGMAKQWYRVRDNMSPNVVNVNSFVCNTLKNQLDSIINIPNYFINLPDEGFLHSWLRSVLGKTAYAAANTGELNFKQIDLYSDNAYVYRTININTHTVVSGNGSSLSHGTGMGYSTPATDPIIKNSLPDFVTRKTWLVNESNIESYRYTPSQTIGMNAKFANIGTSACMGAKKIKVHFYLSKGYKEDNHSAWKLVGTDEIQCSNLRPNDTKIETEGLQISKYNLAVGSIHNIVTCIDHPKTDHNNGGDFKEKHESNNCSTEAVFEVIAESTSPTPVINPTNLPPFVWSSAGVIPNMVCTRILEASDPHTWSDNYFCADKDYGIRWSSAGAIAGMRCTQVIEPADPDTWFDNYICLPNDSPIAFSWSPAGAIAGKECTQWIESADPHTWNDNFLCHESSSTPQIPPFVDFTTNSFQWLQAPYYAGDQARLGGNVYTDGTMNSPAAIRSSYSVECSGTGKVLLTDDGTEANDLIVGKNNWEENKAAVTMPNVSGSCTAYFCADYLGSVSESNETNNCSSLPFELLPRTPVVPPVDPANIPSFAWSSAGGIPNMICTQILEPADPHTWNDNYFCANKDYGIRWSAAGAIAGMRCTQVIEPADPDTWSDNYICLPNDSPIVFSWSAAGAIAGKQCTQWAESADPHTWNDNFLCH